MRNAGIFGMLAAALLAGRPAGDVVHRPTTPHIAPPVFRRRHPVVDMEPTLARLLRGRSKGRGPTRTPEQIALVNAMTNWQRSAWQRAGGRDDIETLTRACAAHPAASANRYKRSPAL